jgi:hypothetical protein
MKQREVSIAYEARPPTGMWFLRFQWIVVESVLMVMDKLDNRSSKY